MYDQTYEVRDVGGETSDLGLGVELLCLLDDSREYFGSYCFDVLVLVVLTFAKYAHT